MIKEEEIIQMLSALSKEQLAEYLAELKQLQELQMNQPA